MWKRTLSVTISFLLFLTALVSIYVPVVKSQETVVRVEAPQEVGQPGVPLPTRFNITVWVYNVTDLFSFQVYLTVNDTMVNIVNAWLPPLTDAEYVFYGKTTLRPTPAFYDLDNDAYQDAVKVGDSPLGPVVFSGDGKLCTIELEATSVGTTTLNIDNDDTFLLDLNLADITITKTGGEVNIVGEEVQRDPSTITIDVNPTEVVVGQTVSINGTIIPSKPNVDVTINYRPRAGTWRTLGTTKTSQESKYVFDWVTTIEDLEEAFKRTFEFKARWSGDETHLPAESEIKNVTVTKPYTSITFQPSPLVMGDVDRLLPTPPSTVRIRVLNVTDLYEWQVKFYYDSDILRTLPDRIWIPEQGHVFEGQAFTESVPEVGTDQGGNYVKFSARLNQTEPPQTPFNGNGTLFQMNFTGIGTRPGETSGSSEQAFSYEDTFLKNSTNELIPFFAINGRIGVYGITVPPLVMSVKNPATQDKDFIFNMETTPLNSRFNATVEAEQADEMFAWQVKMSYNVTLINATRAWLPVWDEEYVFYDRSGAKQNVTFGADYVRVNASLSEGEATFNGTGLLAIIEFEIIMAPPEGGKVSSELDIESEETKWSQDGELWASPDTVNGHYEYSTHPPATDFTVYLPYILGGAVVIIIAAALIYLVRARRKASTSVSEAS